MTRRIQTLIAILGSLGALAFGGVAHAEAKVKHLEFLPLPPPPANPPANTAPTWLYPTVRAKVGTATVGLRAPDFSLKIPEGDKPPEFRASTVVEFKDSNEPMSMIILVQGNVRFMGDPNPDPVPGEEVHEIPGDYDQIKMSLETLAKARVRQSKVGLLIYGEKIITRVPLGDPASINADSLGPQKDYSKITSKALKLGIETAVSLLAPEPGRRVLILIGDGGDIDVNVNLTDTVKKLSDASIEVYAIVASPVGIDPKDKAHLDKLRKAESGGDVLVAQTADQIPQQAEIVAASINNVYTVEFPGLNVDSGVSLPFDGADHDIIIKAKGEETEPVTRTFPLVNVPKPPPPAPPASKTWLWVLLGVLGVVLIGVIAAVLLGGKKKEEEHHEEEAPAPVVPAYVAPAYYAPAAPAPPPPPQKTMMFGVGGTDEGMPIVGWVVPLNGPMAYQTFKLQSGKTVIGTTNDCTVAVSDPFMSLQHAEVVMDAQGFKLMDKGSTNGTMVLGKKISSHELLDNDVFTLGKTDFKFKSIN